MASTNEDLRRATADVFESWLNAASHRLEHAGIAPLQARQLSLFALSALEGSFVLSRAQRNISAIDAARSHVTAAIREALPKARRPRGGAR